MITGDKGEKQGYTLDELVATMQDAIKAGYMPKVYINGELYPLNVRITKEL